jgi:hypothetical protein
MYRIEDSTAAVKELQRLLGLKQTGNYDGKTANAVKMKQDEYSLEKTGIADYETFTLIVDEYRVKRDRVWNSSYLHSPKFPYVNGDMGDDEGRINEALYTVLKEYSYEGTLPRGGYLGDDSFYGVKYLRDIFGMEQRDEIDEQLMNRILAELEAIKIKKRGMK